MSSRHAQDAMVGLVVVTHGGAAEALLGAVSWLFAPIPRALGVSVQREESFEAILARIGAACEEVDEGAGVLLLVDLQGSSPYQAAMAMLDGSRRAEVLCGVNLAMLMKLATLDRRELRPAELAELLREAGRRSIRLGSELTGRLPLGEHPR